MKMAKAVTIYGIKNCDTMKKARAWLDKRGVTYEFHDYKSAGIERSMLEGWARQAGWEALINRAGRTFRAFDTRSARFQRLSTSIGRFSTYATLERLLASRQLATTEVQHGDGVSRAVAG